MRDSFVIMTEHADIIEDLTDEQAGIVFKALMASQLDKETEVNDQAARIVFKAILAQVNRSHALYDKRVASGKQGAEKRWNDSKQMASYSKPMANDSKPMASDSKPCKCVPESVLKETLPKGSVKKSGFQPPTLQEVTDYVSEKGYNISPERFVDFYESKGWMIGKNKMKDWKAAVKNWSRSQRQEKTTEGRQEKNRFNNFPQRKYDFDELEKRLLRG